jgi:methyl-accepting chemotaxis protein
MKLVKTGITKMRSISSRMLLWIGATAVVLFVLGVFVTNVVKQRLLDSAVAEFRQQEVDVFEGRIETKLKAGVGAAVAIASSQTVKTNVALQDYETLAELLQGIAADYKQKTDYKNIQFLIADEDGNFLLRTYHPEPDTGRGKDATYRAGIKEILAGKETSHTGIDLSSGGLVMSSMTPVEAKGKAVGVLEFRTGFGSINDELLKQHYFHISLLNDHALETFKAGKNNTRFGSYTLADNHQFRDAAQQWYAPLPIDAIIAAGKWQDQNSVVTALPITNAKNEIIGYHLLGFDKQILAARFAELDSVAHTLEGIMLALVIGIMLVVWLAVRSQVAKPIAQMQQQLAKVQQSGRFDQPITIVRDDEMGQMATAVNGLLSMLSHSLGSVNLVLTKVAEGDFRQRIEADLPGDLGVLKDNLNTAVSALQDNMKALSHAMDALGRGHFAYRMDTSVEAHMRAQVDNALKNLGQTIAQINVSMGAVAAGDFSQELTIEAQGDWVTLKDSVNGSIRALRASMDELAHAADTMSQGDLTVQIKGQYQGELMRIAQAFNAGVHSVHDSLTDIARASAMVAQAAGEVAMGNTDLSNRTQTQALSVEKTASAMTHMTHGIAQTADNAQQARVLAANTQSAAQSGVVLMDQTVQAMREIGEANQKITAIVSLIDSIAFQTNLLALNAAVEAARAGEHGRGFAVVASEVRALAGKSADAAKDIKQLIDQTVVKVETGDTLVAQTVEAFAAIQARLSETDAAIATIATAMTEQREGVVQVNHSIADIDQSTQQNAALVEETSAAAETMRSQAQEVQERVARFRLSMSNGRLLSNS